MVTEIEIGDLLKPLLLKDLRIQCRARNLNPGGSRESLLERVKDDMISKGDLTIHPDPEGAPIASSFQGPDSGREVTNNYVRPEGQNTGNFITERPSSRVLAPPGGGSQITFG